MEIQASGAVVARREKDGEKYLVLIVEICEAYPLR